MNIDARGFACPKPVIMTKKAIDRENLKELTVIVDNFIATENLKKMAQSMGFDAEVKKDGEDYYVDLKKILEVEEKSSDNYVVVFDSDKMGDGDEEFSKKLLEGFIVSMCTADTLPSAVIFYNRGVFLTAKAHKALDDLIELSKKVEILSCGLCLNYYGLTEELQVGKVTNMYEIFRTMSLNRVVRP